VGVRRLGSLADSVFYVAALCAAWHLHPDAIRAPLTRYAVDLRKFGKEARYHMGSSKLWGVALFAGFLVLLAFGAARGFVPVAIWVGVLADLEGLAISFVLREWRTDVPTLWHALRWRGASATVRRPGGA